MFYEIFHTANELPISLGTVIKSNGHAPIGNEVDVTSARHDGQHGNIPVSIT